MDIEPVAPSPAIQKFLDRRHIYGEDEDDNYNNLQKSLQKKAALLEQYHQHQMKQIHASRAYGIELVKAARTWAEALGKGAIAGHATAELQATELMRNLDSRLLSLTVAGFAEIEYAWLSHNWLRMWRMS